jgi:hypothetical protein
MVTMKRLISIASAALLTVFGLVASTGPTRAKVPGPNGQITFQRFDPSTRAFAVYRVNPDGSHLELVFDTGADGPHWSPDANHRLSIWGVNPNGTGLHQIPIPGCGGAFSSRRSIGCLDPVWSPDGTKIAFTRQSPSAQNIYTVNPDGSGLFQVTRGGSFSDGQPDWGTHPLAT